MAVTQSMILDAFWSDIGISDRRILYHAMGPEEEAS